MPRGSKPGERCGGRQRGTPNKKTALRNAAVAAAAANPEISPLEILLGIMRDPKSSSELRIKAAQATRPFVHAKPGSARPGDPAGTAKLIDGTGAFTIDNAVAKALRDDYHRLGELVRKNCDRGALQYLGDLSCRTGARRRKSRRQNKTSAIVRQTHRRTLYISNPARS
jgi:hypothetical protein